MIILEPGSKIIEEVLRDKLRSDADKGISVLADFDGVTFRISNSENKNILMISMAMICFKELEQFGASQVLAREYGSYYQPTPEPGYDVTLSIDLQTLPADVEPLIKACSLLKRNALAAPFEVAFAAQQQQQESALMAIPYRINEAIYIKALPDRVTVIFSTEFKDETDKIYGKVFLQEFVDARRLPAIQNAPQVLYSQREPPLELRGLNLKDSDSVGYITFVLFPRHFQGQAAYDCISKIQMFRDYFHYHIKASKAYMHSRMRARVDSFLKVLNRAKPEKPGEAKTAR
ncbi:hypothetical protein HDV06_004149 [Boothiomyces sp. JEL0866]|nr:hypothetical protein HDV06_004149 [Boothiomyces sp. JEL0866]